MEKFDYEKYLEGGYEVVTRDGESVTQLHRFDVNNRDEPYELVGVISGVIENWLINGNHYSDFEESPNDLFLKKERNESWINLYYHDEINTIFPGYGDMENRGGSKRCGG